MPVRTKLMNKLGFGRSSRRKSQVLNSQGSQTPPTPAASSPSPSSVSNLASGFPCSTVVLTTNPEPVKVSPSPPPVLATTSQDLWFDALQKLSSDDQQIILAIQSTKTTACPLSERIEELVGMTRLKQQECETKYYRFSFRGKELILRDVAEKTIFWLNKVKGIGDVAVGFDQAHASLPWAGVRLMLQVAVAESEQMGALLVAVEKVIYLVNRCTVYESLYQPRSTPAEPLQNFHGALIELYAAVLQLVALSHCLFSKNTATRTLHALVKPNEVLESVAKCQDLERQVDIEAQNCERALSRDSRALDAKVRMLLEDLSTPILRCDAKVSSLLETITDEERLKILDWISSVLYGQNHGTVKDTRTAGTCEWILKRPSYTEWKNTSSSMILWLYGTAGTGKTYLASRVIDEICGTLKIKTNDEGFAFFYCNRNESVRRDPLAVLRSFVRQLSSSVSNQHMIQTRIREYYIQTRTGASEPTINECKGLLLELMNIYPKTTLILDALDECEEHSRSVLIELFNYLVSQAARPVKIFISSRPDIDIKNTFSSHTNIGIQATDNDDDISRFVKGEIIRHPRWNKMSAELQNDIIETLQQGSQGIFQWAYLQIKQLLVLQQERPIRNRLGKLPIDLEDAYDEIFDGMDETEREIADRALQWVMCAETPLRSEVLLPAVCQTGGELIYHIGDLDEDLILKYCRYLLIVDPIRGVWVPYHLSVIEYCEKHLRSQRQANCLVASVCLALLNAREEKLTPAQILECQINNKEHNKLLAYAADTWVFHVQRCEGWEDKSNYIPNNLGQFLGSPTESGAAYRRWVKLEAYSYIERLYATTSLTIRDLEPASIPAFAACAFGFYTTLPNWWANPWPDYGQRANSGHSLLQLAAMAGSFPICKRLLDWGVDVNEQLTASECGSVLQEAGRNYAEDHKDNSVPKPFKRALEAVKDTGNKQAMCSVIKSSKTMGLLHHPHGNTLMAALSSHNGSNRARIVRLLLKAGADVNAEFLVGNWGSALEIAANTGSKEVVQLLIDAGADVNASYAVGLYGSALAAAASSYHDNKEVVQLLLDAGADVNAPLAVGWYGCALTAAAFWCQKEIVQLLLDAGADVNASYAVGLYGSALAAAASSYHDNKEVVQLLLDAGADVNASLAVGWYGSALAVAAFRCQKEIVQLLLDAGADVNASYAVGWYGSALVAAASSYHDNKEVIQLLLDAGADVNASLAVGWYGSALVAAASSYHDNKEVIQLLLDAGADVNASLAVGWYGSALVAAASSYHDNKEVIQLLLDAGADVNASLAVGWYGSALVAAASSYHDNKEVIQLLLDAGADVNALLAVGWYGSALVAAASSYHDNKEVIQLLLDAGADVNVPPTHGRFGSPLIVAASSKSLDLVKLLVEQGARINVPLQEDRASALEKAAFRRSVEIVEFLVDSGAEFEVADGNGGFRTVLAKEVEYDTESLCKELRDNYNARFRRIVMEDASCKDF